MKTLELPRVGYVDVLWDNPQYVCILTDEYFRPYQELSEPVTHIISFKLN